MQIPRLLGTATDAEEPLGTAAGTILLASRNPGWVAGVSGNTLQQVLHRATRRTGAGASVSCGRGTVNVQAWIVCTVELKVKHGWQYLGQSPPRRAAAFPSEERCFLPKSAAGFCIGARDPQVAIRTGCRDLQSLMLSLTDLAQSPVDLAGVGLRLAECHASGNKRVSSHRT